MTKYKPTIGLEIHAELKTKTKMFCDSKNDPDEIKPNINICPVCMAHPGTLPVINKQAVKNVLKVGLALGSKLADFTEFDRKNYFYPDIPKGYQISQYKYPLVSGGSLAGVEVTRVHLEEDTAKSTHSDKGHSLIDYNRAGIPLMELVTEPVVKDAKQAGDFAREFQILLRYLGVSDANMEKGEMRVEANISVSDTDEFGTKVEVKNLNSFRVVEKAIEYEIKRQIEVIENGGKIIQETRGWDENKQATFSQRLKEGSEDYRYFPDPDLPKLKISEIEDFKREVLEKEIPELPWEKRERYEKDFGIKSEDIEMYVVDNLYGDFFESIAYHLCGNKKLSSLRASEHSGEAWQSRKNDDAGLLRPVGLAKTDEKDGARLPEKLSSRGSHTPATLQGERHPLNNFSKNKDLIKLASNYITSDLVGLKKETNISGFGKLEVESFSNLIKMTDEGLVGSRGAKDILRILFEKGGDAKQIAEQNNLIQKSDEGELKEIILKIITDNSSVVEEYKNGKESALQFLIGQGMKETKGSANPKILLKLFKDNL